MLENKHKIMIYCVKLKLFLFYFVIALYKNKTIIIIQSLRMTFIFCHKCPQKERYTDVVQLNRRKDGKYIGICCAYHAHEIINSFEDLSDEKFMEEQKQFQNIRLVSIQKWILHIYNKHKHKKAKK